MFKPRNMVITMGIKHSWIQILTPCQFKKGDKLSSLIKMGRTDRRDFADVLMHQKDFFNFATVNITAF